MNALFGRARLLVSLRRSLVGACLAGALASEAAASPSDVTLDATGAGSTEQADDDVDAPDEEPIRPPDHTDARVGFGFDVAGGGLLGFTTQVRVGPGMWMDFGLHLRVAITPPDAPDHVAPALTVTWLHELGPSLVKPAYFIVLGTTPPWAYREAFIAAGPAMRIWSPRRTMSHTLAFGPGWFALRVVPGARPAPPLMLFFRYALHFQRADSRIPKRR